MDEIQAGALKALDGMAEMVRAEMVARHYGYISFEVIVPERKDAICGGHKACAYGSYLIGGGCTAREVIANAGEAIRPAFFKSRPALKAGYDALHRAGIEAGHKLGVYGFASPGDYDGGFDWSVEDLFEGEDIKPAELLPIIDRAKEIVAS